MVSGPMMAQQSVEVDAMFAVQALKDAALRGGEDAASTVPSSRTSEEDVESCDGRLSMEELCRAGMDVAAGGAAAAPPLAWDIPPPAEILNTGAPLWASGIAALLATH